MSGISIPNSSWQPVVLAAAIAAACFSPAPFSNVAAQGAKPTPLIENVIIRGLGEKCLDISRASKKTGANVQLRKCHGKAHQRWVFYTNGTIKSMMKSMHKNGYKPCLSVRPDNNVAMAGCGNGVDASGRWLWKLSGLKIVSRRNVCLSAKKKSNNVRADRCTRSSGQHWKIALLSKVQRKPPLLFKSPAGLCLGLADAPDTGKTRTRVLLMKCSGKKEQSWLYAPDRTIRNFQNKKCLRVEDFGAKQISEIYTEPCTRRTEGLWVLQKDKIILAFGKRCLDHRHVKGLVRAMHCQGSRNKWEIVPAPKS